MNAMLTIVITTISHVNIHHPRDNDRHRNNDGNYNKIPEKARYALVPNSNNYAANQPHLSLLKNVFAKITWNFSFLSTWQKDWYTKFAH